MPNSSLGSPSVFARPTMSMVERYAHQSGAHIAEALDKLDARYRSEKPT
jgi:hypothetical protein